MQSITEQPESSAVPHSELPVECACPACGTTARRAGARFCATCGRRLNESYLPSDALRASYHLQQQRLVRQSQPRSLALPAPARAASPALPAHPSRTNGASTTALAFVTYSLVPYLGILFCPGAIVMGGLGLLNWHRAPHSGGRRASSAAIIFGLVILSVQMFLWWILYKVPQWARW